MSISESAFENCETADNYEKFRSRYPSEVIDLLRRYLKIEAKVVDLACGTGFLAREIAHKVRLVVAIDRSEEMLQVGEKRAIYENCLNISWIKSRLPEVPAACLGCDCVTIGNALHWIADTFKAEKLWNILSNDGIVFVVTRKSFLHGEESWKPLIKDLFLNFLEKKDREKLLERLGRIADHQSYFEGSKFQLIHDTWCNVEVQWPIESYFGFLKSTSYAEVLRGQWKIVERFLRDTLPIEPKSRCIREVMSYRVTVCRKQIR